METYIALTSQMHKRSANVSKKRAIINEPKFRVLIKRNGVDF